MEERVERVQSEEVHEDGLQLDISPRLESRMLVAASYAKKKKARKNQS